MMGNPAAAPMAVARFRNWRRVTVVVDVASAGLFELISSPLLPTIPIDEARHDDTARDALVQLEDCRAAFATLTGMARSKGACHIGTSGYQYDHWRGDFYPEDLAKSEWFGHYAKTFETVEINNTFYNLPSEDTFKRWKKAAPEGFCYALKYSRYGTHMKRLKDPETHVDHFWERAKLLGGKRGPILVQLPPRWHANAERLDAFLDYTSGHADWVVEMRDPTWLCDEIYDVLRKHKAALCLHDMLENEHPWVLTADWTYLRFHGTSPNSKYEGSYPAQTLKKYARRIVDELEAGHDVYAYFNNDVGGHAVRNALMLREFVAKHT